MKKAVLITLFVLAASFSSYAQEGFLGEVRLFAGNFAPRGWAFCDGQLLSINNNTALFSILGTTYGGDGRTTFALPDLRGRTAVGPRRGPGMTEVMLGQQFGPYSNAGTAGAEAPQMRNNAVSQGATGINYIICLYGTFPSRN